MVLNIFLNLLIHLRELLVVVLRSKVDQLLLMLVLLLLDNSIHMNGLVEQQLVL